MNLPPHAFTLRQLQYAVAVADAASFRGAAQRCRVSQPALSAQVAQLEGALGVALFERTTRKVWPTGAGRELLARARAVLREADDLATLARRAADPLAGPLRLGVIPTIAPYLLPALGRALGRALPRLLPLWVEDKTAALVAAVESGDLDAALLAAEADLGALTYEALAVDPFVLAAARRHPLGRATGAARLSDLEGQPVLLLDDGHCLRDQALSVCGRAHAEELAFRATSLPTLVQLAARGLGVTLLPSLAVATEARRAGLRVRRFVDPAPGRTLALAWRRSSPLDAALRRLAETLRESLPAPRRRRGQRTATSAYSAPRRSPSA
jgi:LysR family hydrogen peroxide-inducible transcriptional activator